MDKKLRNLIFSLIGLFFAAYSEAGHVEHAKMLKQHGLIDDAKRFFIEIVHSELATDADKATSLYNLGVIAFNAKQPQVAFDTWQDLIEQYPESDEGKIVSERISYLASEIVELSSDVIEDEIARSYLQHGDFWSDDIKRRHWLIDSSWLDKIELACEWYDKVIAEFPGTPAAKLAYLEKFRTILGKDGAESYETRKSFSEYIEPLLATYEDFVKAFPDSDLIPLLKFQIAQAYWGEEDRAAKNLLSMDSDSTALIIPHSYAETEKWLKSVIEDGNTNNFYTQVATARLEAIETAKLEAVKQAEEAIKMKARMDKIERTGGRHLFDIKSDLNTISAGYRWSVRNTVRFVLSDSTITLYSEYPRLTLVRPIRQFDNFRGSMEDFIEMMLKDAKSENK